MSDMPGARAVAALHGGVVSLYHGLFDKGRLKTERLPRPVVSVGNLAVGGTGKTPFVEELARMLSLEGYLACILSRGYLGVRSRDPMIVSDLLQIHHGAAESGDEPYLLARRLPGVPVVVGADRCAAGRLALERLPVHLFLLDDGFQHRRIQRDVDIVLLDAADPWAGGELLPAGRLREPLGALKRASAIGLTRADRVPPARIEEIKHELAGHAPGVPVFTARSQPTALRRLPRGLESLDALRKGRWLAFAGLARPEAFFADLRALGASVASTRPYEDHHPYTTGDVRELCEAARSAGADALVTTEKDAVRLPRPPKGELPFYALRQRTLVDAPDALLRFVVSKVEARRERQ